MKKSSNETVSHAKYTKEMLPLDGAFLDGIYAVSGRTAIDRILNHPDPPRLIQCMSSEDLGWLIQKVGVDSSVELLEMATPDQWQYVLDVELWRNDRLESAKTGRWLMLLAMADTPRLVQWLLSEGQGLAFWFFNQSLEIDVPHEDEAYDIRPDFFSIDGRFYVRALRTDQRKVIEKLLRAMADEDILKYQALLTGLYGVLPAQLEEDMYRMRNIRLAEHGFLPGEEAVAVYAPLSPKSLKTDIAGGIEAVRAEDAGSDLVVRRSLHLVEGESFFLNVLSTVTDSNFLDRIRLEFAGLCNQMASADGLSNRTEETFRNICFRAAGYLNLILRERCEDDSNAALNFLRNNSLLSLFRAGFGLALNLKWRTQRWLKASWFYENGLDVSFWGETWGRDLRGVLRRLPQAHRAGDIKNGYGDFTVVSEIENANETLDHLAILDHLMRLLVKAYEMSDRRHPAFDVTVQGLLITFWAREMLNMAPGFEPVGIDGAKTFLSSLRTGETHPPYRMFGFEERFVSHLSNIPAIDGDLFLENDKILLKEALSRIWREFSDEMEPLPVDQLTPKYSKYLRIKSG